jgi:hypothetical protein
VYQAVASDSASQQTPHFGYLNGDGDMILKAPFLEEKALAESEGKGEDVLFSVPSILMPEHDAAMTNPELLKEMLSEERSRLKMHDYVAQEVREVMSQTANDYFPLSQELSTLTFIDRIQRYESAIHKLVEAEILIGYWGDSYQRPALTLALKRLGGRLELISGDSTWLDLRWYPITLLMYAGGIAAVAAKKYENLYDLLYASVSDQSFQQQKHAIAIGSVTKAMENVNGLFKKMPSHERHYAPLSEYLYKLIQPTMDDLLFLGTEYEDCFDRFEVLHALEYTHRFSSDIDGRAWGLIGRFGWKTRMGGKNSPFHTIVSEAQASGESWAPLRAGFFNGSIQTFNALAIDFGKLLQHLGWR